MRDVATILNCLFCDAYFLLVLCGVELDKGSEAVSARLAALGRRYAGADRFTNAACPRCCEAASGKPWEQLLASGDPSVLTPCRFVSFGGAGELEAPALYVDEADEGQPPAFKLRAGAGPPALELERSGRGGPVLSAACLWACGIEPAAVGALAAAPRRPAVVRQRADLVWQALAGAGPDRGALLGALERLRPALGRWGELEAAADLAGLAMRAGGVGELDLSLARGGPHTLLD